MGLKTTLITVIGHQAIDIQNVIKSIAAGEPVIFPTDTVYGIGCDPFNEAAINALYVAKDRPQEKGIPVLVSSREKADELGVLSTACQALLDKHWPGALSVVVPQKSTFPANLSANRNVALRMPDHPLAVELVEAAGGALATTSANRSGQPPALSYEDAVDMFPALLVVDGGTVPGGVASTVIDCTSDEFTVLRQGPITL